MTVSIVALFCLYKHYNDRNVTHVEQLLGAFAFLTNTSSQINLPIATLTDTLAPEVDISKDPW